MRTYDIVDDATGATLRTETIDDPIRPAHMAGQSLRLTHVDGEPAIQGEPLRLTEEERAALPRLEQAPAGEVADYVTGHSEAPAAELGAVGGQADGAPPDHTAE